MIVNYKVIKHILTLLQMKILHTIPYFSMASGGPTTCTYHLVKGLVNRGVECNILTFTPKSDEILAEDDFISYLPDDRRTPLWISKSFCSTLKSIIHEYNILHVNTIWSWPPHVSVKESQSAQIPVVLSVHGMLHPQALRISAWKKRIISKLYLRHDLDSVDCIHATSEEEAAYIRDFGVSNPIAIIPNCLSIDEFPVPRETTNNKYKLGFVGRLNPIKNVNVLLEAWNLMGNRNQDCELYIIGDGSPSYVDKLKEYVRKNELNNVFFTGFLSGDDLHATVRSLDFQILPSKSENFGMVVPEALLCGVPVIASKGTPWKVLEQEHCGWWINANPQAITEAMSNAIQLNDIQRQNMGRLGRQFVINTYGSEIVSKNMQILYEWLCFHTSKPGFIV